LRFSILRRRAFLVRIQQKNNEPRGLAELVFVGGVTAALSDTGVLVVLTR